MGTMLTNQNFMHTETDIKLKFWNWVQNFLFSNLKTKNVEIKTCTPAIFPLVYMRVKRANSH